ncbi:YciI family protein [Hyphococcus flavus]|uniref:YciI family protein n=1 Tax=Hyphococcus flavus TaxID=1866326 RepID=A0AAE9ZB67_9PROT|nr:YciI family protein [Hyphococcus flavus]WDI30781.1 YciI family protein [Hyphococcus flavus]
MRLLFLPAILLLAATFSTAYAGDENDKYDAALAEELGADDYGMRSYIFVMLRTGPADAEITDAERRNELFAGHFANIRNLAEEGKLVLAGPLSNGTNERGLYVLNVETIEDAQALMENDPTIVAGVFTAEYINFYGSAALMKLNDIHAKIQKTAVQ